MFETSQLAIYEPVPLSPHDYQGIRDELELHGVCVIQDILSSEEQDQFLDYFWDAIQLRKKKILREDTSTWTPNNTEWHGTFGAGQYKHYGMAQEKHCWLVRKNEKIRQIFERGVYGSNSDEEFHEPCCVSLDGCAALFNPVVSQLQLHVDLVPGLEGFDFGSVQGAYNLYPVTVDPSQKKATSGFVCVVGSHKSYDQLWEERQSKAGYSPPKKHWHVLEPESPFQSQASFVISPANSLVLWRSDLLHKNYGGDYTSQELTPPEAPPRLCRLTQFVTFQPTKFRSEKALESKMKCVLDGACMTHWAALGVRVPIIAFPCWSAKAKEITVRVPTFEVEKVIPEEVIEREENEEIEEETDRPDTKKKRKSVTKNPPKKKKKELLSGQLPADILSLL